jgi:DNA-binding CsgD family transcriptional regulator
MPLRTTVIVYGLALAAGTLFLRWLEYRHALRLLPTEIYVVAVALVFTGLGLWLGRRLSGGSPPPFEKNVDALRYLGVSEREQEVLALLADGLSNREIAERLFVSPNTVKTHIASLYAKLGAARRTDAVRRARELRLIP